MDGKILIVGGYGNVGQVIASSLGNRFPGHVIVAGRNYQKAQAFAQETRGTVLPMMLDIFAVNDIDALLNDVSLIIMCIDQTDTRFVEQCIRRGIHYVDVSANAEFLAQVEGLDAEAKKGGTTVVLSVGLAPGLTNLLASHGKDVFDEVQRVDLFILLGLGEAHGEASMRWTLKNINTDFWVSEAGKQMPAHAFAQGKQTRFPDPIGRRTAYRFHFPDQQILPKTLGIDSVATWLCFDSALVTHAFALLKKAGLFRLLGIKPVQETFIKTLHRLHFGSDQFIVQADITGVLNHQPRRQTYTIAGNGEGRATGLVAALVAERLYASFFPAGVFHLEQISDPFEFLQALCLRVPDLRWSL